MIRVFQVKCSSQENKEIEKQLLKKLNISKKDLFSWRIHRKSVDARKQKVLFSYVIDCQIKNEKKALKDKDTKKIKDMEKDYEDKLNIFYDKCNAVWDEDVD